MPSCPRCLTTLVKIDDSPATLGTPPGPATSWYVCPNCGEQVVLNRDRNAMARRFAPEDLRRFIQAGKLAPDGRLPRSARAGVERLSARPRDNRAARSTRTLWAPDGHTAPARTIVSRPEHDHLPPLAGPDEVTVRNAIQPCERQPVGSG